jgi:hypothetical protein
MHWLSRLTHNPIMPVFLITVVYFVAVTLTSYTADHLQTFDDRYQALLYFLILIVLFLSLDELILNHLHGLPKAIVMVIVIGVFSVWGFYRVALLNDFVKTSKDRGVVAYNDYNTKKMIRSGLVVYLIKNPLDPGVALYSNEPEALYFFLRRPVEMSPVDPSHYVADPESLKPLYPRWPEEESAYLVWFRPNTKRHYYSPAQLEQFTQMDKLYKRYDGDVYLIKPKE